MTAPIERIAIVARPQSLGPVSSASVLSARAFHGYDDFAAALAMHTQLEVLTVEAPVASLGNGTFVLLDETIDERDLIGCDPSMSSRIVLLNAERAPGLLETLEQWRLAGGVETNRYRRWRYERDRESGHGLFGLRAVATEMGATCAESGVFATERYSSIGSDACRDLPQLIARYVDAFRRLGL